MRAGHLLSAYFFCLLVTTAAGQPLPRHGLRFQALATSWDEGIPLGNGMMGAIVWNRSGRLRLALDRADLWDLRPMPNMDRPEFRFSWVHRQLLAGTYAQVQEMFDLPYDTSAGPTKIPAAALEFEHGQLGTVSSAELDITTATCHVRWSGGATLTCFIHATEPVGWFRWENLPAGIRPELVPPPYSQSHATPEGNVVSGQKLARLGYKQGTVDVTDNSATYTQGGWGGFQYVVAVRWQGSPDGSITGAWSISTTTLPTLTPSGWPHALKTHQAWWSSYWSKSSISIPDTTLERQWYLEQYKFGSSARRGAPPISLQAVWTADHGNLPPWKGDFHHDLNTQLSYWPCYSANHLEEGLGFLDWLWSIIPTAERYTSTYFGTTGLNVPGVTTLSGEPMGGWIQYSLSPTIGAWLGHHFYLHWRYSMDQQFLRERAYPWLSAVARHIQELSVQGPDGYMKLPLSSSPEFHDNTSDAWFDHPTNYDLALVRWTFSASAELAEELGQPDDARRWRTELAHWPQLALGSDGALLVATGHPYEESHRHFSHLMAIYPLSILNWSDGKESQSVIAASLRKLDTVGPDYWTGYSYAWLATLRARALDGEGAADALRTFARCFCLPNSFHVNGDQSGSGKSKFTYRPFTLEGNFACAAGIQEMLLQSTGGRIRVFPAIPQSWENASFQHLRAEGAFLVSATRHGGITTRISVTSEVGGTAHIELAPGTGYSLQGIDPAATVRLNTGLEMKLKRNQTVTVVLSPP